MKDSQFNSKYSFWKCDTYGCKFQQTFDKYGCKLNK